MKTVSTAGGNGINGKLIRHPQQERTASTAGGNSINGKLILHPHDMRERHFTRPEPVYYCFRMALLTENDYLCITVRAAIRMRGMTDR